MNPPATGAAPATGPVRPVDFDVAAALSFARDVVEQEAHTALPLVVMLPVPRIDPIRLFFEGDASADAFYWRDREGTLLAGVGVALELRASGADRFRMLAEQAEALAEQVAARAPNPAGTPPPRFFGGFAFAPGSADGAEWGQLGDARFVLPSFGYHAERDEAWLTFALSADQLTDRALRAGALQRLDSTLRRIEALALARETAREASAGAAEDDAVPGGDTELPRLLEPPGDAADDAAFERRVQAALEAIGAGHARKIVLARRARGRLSAAASTHALLDQLRRAVGAFRFALRAGDAFFLGASPERLVARHGEVVQTEAVAGTIAADDAEALGSRDKDQREQEMVVRAIAETLAPLCACLSYDPAPLERRVGPVRHLSTTFECRLRERPHVLRVLEALHPTPAVGGSPTAAALEWIATGEPDARGWYAGPIGWFDAAGDGEFAVALRCGLVNGTALDLFAGAGIVAGSDPRAEREETRLKLSALPEALGITS